MSLSTSLETAGNRSNHIPGAIELQSLQSVAQKSHALVLERNNILQKIRELPGYQKFLLSKPISELSLAAKMGPVAIFNISEYGCDALVLMPGLRDEVIHVPLSGFTIHEAQALVELLVSVVGTPGRSDRLKISREGVLNALKITTPDFTHNLDPRQTLNSSLSLSHQPMDRVISQELRKKSNVLSSMPREKFLFSGWIKIWPQ
ncbi:hypothetical protein C8R44DRAFT_911400 [Mycena epipterygia]|nr:hypothetical protein C8R44DRAFT_911400 [Mycena epipterygia]